MLPRCNMTTTLSMTSTTLSRTIAAVPSSDKLLLLGNFNVRVGTDINIWRGVIGNQGVASCNNNGHFLFGLCAEHGLGTGPTIAFYTLDYNSE